MSYSSCVVGYNAKFESEGLVKGITRRSSHGGWLYRLLRRTLPRGVLIPDLSDIHCMSFPPYIWFHSLPLFACYNQTSPALCLMLFFFDLLIFYFKVANPTRLLAKS